MNNQSFPVFHTQIQQIKENIILHQFGDYSEWMGKRAILKMSSLGGADFINRQWWRTHVKLSRSTCCCEHNELTVSSQLVILGCVKVLHQGSWNLIEPA